MVNLKLLLVIFGMILVFRAESVCNPILLPPAEPDSCNSTKYTWEDVYITAKAGALMWDTFDNLYPGFTANAGIGFGLGSDFFLKPSVSYWKAKTTGKQSVAEYSLGYLVSIEHIMYSDNINFSLSLGAGSFSLGKSGRQPGILAEFGLIYPLDNVISVYAGAGYMNILSLDVGGTEKAYSNLIISAGIYFYVE